MIYFDMLEGVHDNTVGCEDTIDTSETLTEAQANELGFETFFNFIHEAYYGKTKEILAIEKKIGEIREKYRANPMKANTAKEREELEELFCDAFGFACCAIHIEPSNLYNACTLPISSVIFDFRDFSKYIEKKNGALKYKKEANIYVTLAVTKGLLFSTAFTDAEVTAIILHEIGHNFQTTLSGSVYALNRVSKVLDIIVSPIMMLKYPTSSPFRTQIIDFLKKMEKDKSQFFDAYWTINNAISTIKDIGLGLLLFISNIAMMANPLAMLAKIPAKIMKKINISLLKLPERFRSESIADSFTTMYGYGAELSSGLSTMSKLSGGILPDQIIRDMGPIGAYYDLVNLPTKIISNIFDPHPNDIARIKSQYDYIAKELDKAGTNAKMKKELSKQLKDIEKILNEFQETESAGFFFSRAYDKIMLMLFDGDIRSIIAKGTNEEFDAAERKAEEILKQIKSKK